MLGESVYYPKVKSVPIGVNTFSANKWRSDNLISVGGMLDRYCPNKVSSYVRSNGTMVKSFYRDGDGNSGINRLFGSFKKISELPHMF